MSRGRFVMLGRELADGEIFIEVDAGRALSQLIAMLVLLKAGGPKMSLKGAKLIRDHARDILDSGSHPPGTRALRPAPAPPGTRTGKLALSVQARRDVDGWAKVGPTRLASSKNGPYGRFLEMGGSHDGHMRWIEDGIKYEATHLQKAGRPYMRPARDASVAEIHDGVARDVAEIIRTALHG